MARQPRPAAASGGIVVPPMDLGADAEGDGLDALMGTAAMSKAPVGLPKRMRIIVEENDNIPPTGLVVSLNGTAYLIRPGVEVSVPVGVVEILDNARASKPKQDSVTKRIAGWTTTPRFPYRVLRDAA